MRDETLLVVVTPILTLVILSTLAVGDANNPLTEIGIPVSAEDFSFHALASRAPQIEPLTQPTFTNATSYCWISFWCPDLPFTGIAQALHTFTIQVVNFFIFIANIISTGATVAGSAIFNFLVLFNFAGWEVFQGSLFLQLFGVGLTVLPGGSVAMWVIDKVSGAIPFVG